MRLRTFGPRTFRLQQARHDCGIGEEQRFEQQGRIFRQKGVIHRVQIRQFPCLFGHHTRTQTDNINNNNDRAQTKQIKTKQHGREQVVVNARKKGSKKKKPQGSCRAGCQLLRRTLMVWQQQLQDVPTLVHQRADIVQGDLPRRKDRCCGDRGADLLVGELLGDRERRYARAASS